MCSQSRTAVLHTRTISQRYYGQQGKHISASKCYQVTKPDKTHPPSICEMPILHSAERSRPFVRTLSESNLRWYGIQRLSNDKRTSQSGFSKNQLDWSERMVRPVLSRDFRWHIFSSSPGPYYRNAPCQSRKPVQSRQQEAHRHSGRLREKRSKAELKDTKTSDASQSYVPFRVKSYLSRWSNTETILSQGYSRRSVRSNLYLDGISWL